MRSTPKIRLSSHDQSYWVQSMKKTRQDNDLIDHIGVVYVEKYTKLLRPTRPDVAYTKIRHDNDVTNHIDVVYVGKETKLS